MSEISTQGLILLICGGGVFVGATALGGFLIAFGRRSQQLARASQRWPATTGHIIRADVTHDTRSNADGQTYTVYEPRIEYTYQVMGQPYQSQRVAFGATQTYGSPAKAAEQLAPFPVGGPVTVYYNPAQPTEAVLERKAGGVAASFFAGLFCLGLGACLGCALGGGGAFMLLPEMFR